jgi:hypothetical protein
MAALSAAAPFAGDQLDQLDRLLGEAGSERLQWLSGDVAGFRAATAGNGKGGQGHDDPFPPDTTWRSVPLDERCTYGMI